MTSDEPEVDPRYPRRFQRGAPDEPLSAPASRTGEATKELRRDGLGLSAVLIVAGILIVAAAGLVVVAALDADAATGGMARPAGQRALGHVAAVAGGPLLVAGVVGLAAWAILRRHRLAPAVPLLAAAAAFAGLVITASTVARLDAQTAAGPVSSGGIPLPEAGIALYFARVQLDAVLTTLLPWLVLAACLGIVGATVAAVRGRD